MDGTSDRNQHYEGIHANVTAANGARCDLLLGLNRQLASTAVANVEHFDSLQREIRTIWNSSPLGKSEPALIDALLVRAVGTNSDHASTMKATHRLLGELKAHVQEVADGLRQLEVLESEDQEKYLVLCAEMANEAIQMAGGEESWEAMDSNEQKRREEIARERVAQRLGHMAFIEMPQHRQAIVRLWMWFGCCMHKMLNILHAGANALPHVWERIRAREGAVGPILLPNKDNAAALNSTDADIADRAEALSKSGAPKFLGLLALLVRPRIESKAGYGVDWSMFCQSHPDLLRAEEFPPITNNRYQSVPAGGAYVIKRREYLLEFMSLVRRKKNSGVFTNIEQNVFDALQDPPTMTECAAMGLVAECATTPYVRHTRRAGTNAADLGKLHVDLKMHLLNLANSPQLVLDVDPSVSHTNSVFLGCEYTDKSFVVQVCTQHRAGMLPYLAEIFAGFLVAAAAKLDDFTTEFQPGAPLQQLSEDQKHDIFFNATNDLNEGILGFMRRQHRIRPCISDKTLNGIAMYLRNDTREWISGQSTEMLCWLRGAGRDLQVRSAADNRKQAAAQLLHFKTRADENDVHRAEQIAAATAKEAQLNLYQPLTNIADVVLGHGKMARLLLDSELNWHRHRGLPQGWIGANFLPCFIPKQSALKGVEDSKAKLRSCILELDRLGWPSRAWLDEWLQKYPGKTPVYDAQTGEMSTSTSL